ncbi:MAG: hypothetical protein GEV05_15425 [Betaproteobacteria bacterium]|nr:hypothetical protein [Betaproteobacteria bacterium]
MSEQILILEPAAVTASNIVAPRRRALDLHGKRVGIIDNTKPNFDLLADDLGALLMQAYGVSGIVKHRKRAPSVPATAAMMQDLQDKCELIIAGSGD